MNVTAQRLPTARFSATAFVTAVVCALVGANGRAGPPEAPTPPMRPADAGVRAARTLPVVTVDAGLATPESVLYDAESDTYLVSNINGTPLAKDDNGFITELAPTGEVLAAKLVEGGKRGATLHAPKGLAVVKGILYVADIDTVRLFDRKTGAVRGEINLPGATFVNDLTAAPDGTVYATDMGAKAGRDGFEPSGTDAIYAIAPGPKPSARTVVKSRDLHQPNGIAAVGTGLYVVTFGAAELHTFEASGKRVGAAPVTLPAGHLDGVVACAGGLFISSWDAKAVFRRKLEEPGGAFVEVLSGLEAPADIGCDTKRKRLLVPRFVEHRVEVYPLE